MRKIIKKRFNVEYLWSEYFSELAFKLESFIKKIKRKDLVGISNIVHEQLKEPGTYRHIVFVYYYEEEKE